MTKTSKPQRPLLFVPEGIVPSGKPDPAYWQALGRFIEAYAIVESMMFYLLAHYAKVRIDVAKAVFSGTRLDASIKLIRRIIAVTDPGADRRKELELIFAQLIVINDARNDVIHYGSSETLDEGRISSNYVRAHLPENITVRPMSATVLDEMRRDLERVTTHLFVHMSSAGAGGSKARTAVLSHGPSWQYKPPRGHEMKLNKPARRDRSR